MRGKIRKRKGERRSWSWTRRSGSIYHLWSMLLCEATAGLTAKEYLLENLRALTKWKIQQGNPVWLYEVFNIHNRLLLCCWVSKVKSVNGPSSNSRSYFILLKLHGISSHWTALSVSSNTFWSPKMWPHQYKDWKCGNLSTQSSITDQHGVSEWPLFKSLLNSETNHW